MVVKTSNLDERALECEAETNGDLLRLKKGEIEEFRLISPEADSEGMRAVGALGEMLYEQIKKTYGTSRLLLVSQSRDFKLVMFPSKGGFVVWKTNLSLPRIMSAVDLDENNMQGNSRQWGKLPR
jgi:hypothetical protein